DPQAEIYLRLEDGGRYVDVTGTPATPAANPGRIVVGLAGHDALPLAVVVVDERLEANQDSVDVTLNALAVALESIPLRAATPAQLDEVAAVSSRVAEAAYRARRRLERDLRAGTQQHLLSLEARLGDARHTTSDPQTLAALDAARGDLAAALGEI